MKAVYRFVDRHFDKFLLLACVLSGLSLVLRWFGL